jgi:predicted permease
MKKHPLADLDADIRDHIERETQDNIERGMSPEDARYAALRKFGNVALTREDTRAVWIPVVLEQLVQDVHYALRSLRRYPGFSIAAIVMLTIGLGLVAGGYTVFNGLFIRGWAVPDNSRVFIVGAERAVPPSAGYVADGFSVGAYKYVREQGKSADYVATTIQYFRVRVEPGRGGTHTGGMFVSDNFIETLRIPLQLGTGFGGVPVASEPRILISDAVWRRLFGADPNIIGRRAWLTGVATTVVGVTARGFDGLAGRPLDAIVDMSSASAFGPNRSATTLTSDGTTCCLNLAGRIRDDRSLQQVREELNRLTAQYRKSVGQPDLSVTLGGTAPGAGIRLSPRRSAMRVALALIAAGIVLVLLLTCANVGNLYLARSLRRQREIAVRLSLGATRARVVRQLLTEGLVMASVAGVCAFLMTAGVPLVLRLIEDDATATMFASDWRVAAFTAAGVILTCLVVSLAPALQTTRIVWRGATATMTARTGHMRGVVLAAQIAIAAVLVLSATLLARGIGHAVSAPTDFALHTTTAITLAPPANFDSTRVNEFRAALAQAVKSSNLPIGMASTVPAAADQRSVRSADSEIEFRCKVLALTASAFAVLDLKIASGRFASDDPAAAEAVINETLARQMWPTESALGKTLTLSRRTYSIVGIARDAHLTSPSEIEPTVHVAPYAGLPVLLARTTPGLERTITALVRPLDPQLDLDLMPLTETVKQTLENARIGAAIASGLGVVALLLAIVGVFGVFSYLVEERRYEIGIRLALGASPAEIGAALFLASRGAVAGGLVAGLTLSAIAGMSLRRFLFGLSPADPVSYLVVSLVLGTAAIIATAIPIARALRVDPAVTLKAE